MKLSVTDENHRDDLFFLHQKEKKETKMLLFESENHCIEHVPHEFQTSRKISFVYFTI